MCIFKYECTSFVIRAFQDFFLKKKKQKNITKTYIRGLSTIITLNNAITRKYIPDNKLSLIVPTEYLCSGGFFSPDKFRLHN